MKPLTTTNPLQALIQQAAGQPAQAGAIARHQHRASTAGTGQIILADVSGSMAEPAWGGRRKIDVLREAIAGAPPARLISFSSRPDVLPSAEAIPEPNGSTALHLGLEEAAKLRPARTLVISDGRPDDEALALRAADALPGTIDVIYVGPDGDIEAIAFMRRLASRGGGRYYGHDLRKASAALLAPAIRGLLGR